VTNTKTQEQDPVEAVEVAVVEEEASAEEAVVAVEEVGEADSLLEARTGVAEEAGVEAEGIKRMLKNLQNRMKT